MTLRTASVCTLSLALALAFAPPAQAQTELWQTVRERLFDHRTGRQSRPEPVHSGGAIDRWGNSDASRGAHPGQWGDQTRDERLVDERLRDERAGNNRPLQQAAPVVAADKAPVAASVKAPVATKPRPAPTPRPVVRSAPRAQPSLAVAAASCTNVSLAWDGAQALARRGDETRAYDAYLRLLSSCTDERELIGTVHQALRNLSERSIEMLALEPVLEAPKLAPARYALILQRLYGANRMGDLPGALELARSIREPMVAAGDIDALTLSGWLEQKARAPKEAELLFRAALRVDRDAESAREGLVYALLAQDKVASAVREAARLDGPAADSAHAEVRFAQAREDLQQKKYERALTRLDEAEALGLHIDAGVLEVRAWALKGQGKAKEAAELFVALADQNPDDPKLRQGAVETLYAAGEHDRLREMADGNGVFAGEAREAVARRLDDQGRRIEAARLRGETVEGNGGLVAGVAGVRMKSGKTGAGRLTEVTAPLLHAEVPIINDDTRVSVSAQRLMLDDGEHRANGTEVRARVTTRIDDVELMVGAGVSNVDEDAKATFEAKVRQYTDSGHIEAGVSREPVRDSVRAYSGIRVETEEGPQMLGRAFDTSGYLAGSTVLDSHNQYRLDWTAGAGTIKGINTPANGYFRGEVALMKELQHAKLDWFNLGPYLSLASYQRDENQFEDTGQYGGYFSPTSDVGLGMRTNMLSTEGSRMLFKTSGQLGYTSRGVSYGNDSGLVAEASGQVAWLTGSHMALGAGIALRSSPGYTDLSLRFGLTVFFEPRTKLYSTDLNPYQAY